MKNELRTEILDFVKPAVETIVGILQEKDVTQMDLTVGDLRVRVHRRSSRTSSPVVTERPPENHNEVSHASPESEAPEQTLIPVLSELVGLFRRSKGREPVVQISDEVVSGDVLCYIECMKLMYEVRAPLPGTLVEILVEDGQPVEYGQALMAMVPALVETPGSEV